MGRNIEEVGGNLEEVDLEELSHCIGIKGFTDKFLLYIMLHPSKIMYTVSYFLYINRLFVLFSYISFYR